MEQQLFDQEWNTLERARRKAIPNLRCGLLRQRLKHRVQFGVQLLNRRQRSGNEFLRRDLFLCDEVGKPRPS